MLTETISGKCPCCGYDKLLQRYGSVGYLQMDGCPNCGFGYSTNHEEETFGVDAWLPYAKHLLSCIELDNFESKLEYLNSLSDLEVRRLVFDWCQSQERCDDIDETIFEYTEKDVEDHRQLNLPIFTSDNFVKNF